MSNNFYRIKGLIPGERSFNFNVELDADYARAALSQIIGRESQEKMQLRADYITQKVGFPKPAMPSYVFHKDTALLEQCTALGDGCHLGLDGIERENFVKNPKSAKSLYFLPHNINNIQQAYTLLSLWINWAESIEGLKR